MGDHKFIKYLLYAIGEIILIVAGVYIAIQLNNWNETQKADKRTEVLLDKIQEELKDNIKRADYFIAHNYTRDSLLHEIMNDKISQTELEQSPNLLSDILSPSNFSLDTSAYEILIGHLDEIPEDTERIVKTLKELYVDIDALFNFQKEASADMLQEMTLDLKNDNELALASYFSEDYNILSDYVNSPKFKSSMVINTQYTLYTHAQLIERAKWLSVLAYQLINARKDGIIATDDTWRSQKYTYKNMDAFSHWEGTYTNPKDTTDLITIKRDRDKLLYERANGDWDILFPVQQKNFHLYSFSHFYKMNIVSDSIVKGFTKRNKNQIVEYKKQE